MEGSNNDKRRFNRMSDSASRSSIQRMRQTKLTSLIETFMTVGLGMMVSLIAWPFVGALYGIEYSLESHFGITVIFTVLSVARVYIVRRFFAQKIYSKAYKLARKLK